MAVNLEVLLIEAKFTKLQAKIYLTGLELGSCTLMEMTTRCQLPKTSVYESLESLRERKMLTTVHRGRRHIYTMASTERVVAILRTEAQEQAITIDDIARALPVFDALKGGAWPSVVSYEGTEAIYGYFKHIEKTHPPEMFEISNMDDIYKWIDKKVLLDARKSYKWKPKKTKFLFTGTPRSAPSGKENRRMNKAWGNFNGNIALYGNFVSLVTFNKKLTLIIIESKMLADSMRMFFSVVWRASDEV